MVLNRFQRFIDRRSPIFSVAVKTAYCAHWLQYSDDRFRTILGEESRSALKVCFLRQK